MAGRGRRRVWCVCVCVWCMCVRVCVYVCTRLRRRGEERERERVWKRLYIPGSTNVPPRYALFQKQLPAARIIPPRSILISAVSLSLSLFLFRCIPSHASPAKVQVEGWNEDDRPRHVHTNDLVPPRHLLQVCTLLYPLFQCGRLRLSPSPNAPSALHDCSYSHTHTCSHTLTLSHTRSLYPCTVSCVR